MLTTWMKIMSGLRQITEDTTRKLALALALARTLLLILISFSILNLHWVCNRREEMRSLMLNRRDEKKRDETRQTLETIYDARIIGSKQPIRHLISNNYIYRSWSWSCNMLGYHVLVALKFRLLPLVSWHRTWGHDVFSGQKTWPGPSFTKNPQPRVFGKKRQMEKKLLWKNQLVKK